MGERELALAFRSLLQAVDHLHSVRVVHRDIKPCNLLLKDGQTGENVDVKICDMGLAAMLPPEDLKHCGCIPAKQGLTEICGTTPYMSPEMLLQKRPYSELVDEWSCGVTMYVLLFGEFPYKTINKDMELMRESISSGRFKPSFRARRDSPQPSSHACELVAALMTRNPENRPSCADALTYPFLELLLPTPTHPSCSETNTDDFVIPPVAQLCTSPTQSRTRERLPSFHPTLLHAKSVLQEYDACTPLKKKRTFEEALEFLQNEQGQQWQRNGSRCFSEPFIRGSSELQRLPARFSTHSGTSLSTCISIEEEQQFVLKFGGDTFLPGTPSTIDDDCFREHQDQECL